MQVYFESFGRHVNPNYHGKFTPHRRYDARKVRSGEVGDFYEISDDNGIATTVFVGQENSLWTGSIWMVDSASVAGSCLDTDPEVFAVGMVLCEDNTCEAVMDVEGVLSDFTPPEIDALYVNAEAFKAVADQLKDTERQLADIKSENTALVASIERVNEVLGPNADTDETLADKVKRVLLERGQEGFDQCAIGAKGGRMRPGRVPVVRDKNGEFVHPVFNLPENKGLYGEEVAEKYGLECFEAVSLDPVFHVSFDNFEDPQGWFLVKSTYGRYKKILSTWFREYDSKRNIPRGI